MGPEVPFLACNLPSLPLTAFKPYFTGFLEGLKDWVPVEAPAHSRLSILVGLVGLPKIGMNRSLGRGRVGFFSSVPSLTFWLGPQPSPHTLCSFLLSYLPGSSPRADPEAPPESPLYPREPSLQTMQNSPRETYFRL